jgi:4-amino-4-deoxy-L-arabinose transferase-like glycosyltransferase
MHPRWSWWLLLILVGTFALAFRLYYVTHVVVFQPANEPHSFGDAVQYYSYARNLVDHFVFSVSRPGVSRPLGDSFRDPGYPVFLAALMEVFPHWNSWYAAVLFSQALLSGLTVVLWLCVGRRWMSIGWLTAAGIIMAVWPHSVAMSSNLMTETLLGFLVALALWVFGFAVDRGTHRWAMASGACFAVTALTNAALLPFPFLLALYMLARRQLRVAVALILIVTMFGLTIPWSIRNAMQPAGQPSSSDRAIMNLVQGSWPLYHSATKASLILHNPRATQVVNQINLEISTMESNHIAGLRMMWHRMSLAPAIYLLWYLKKPTQLWGWNLGIGAGDIYFHVTYHSPFNDNPFWRGVAAVCQASNLILLLLALTGCMLAVSRRKLVRDMSSTGLLMLFVTAVYSLLQADARYSIPYRGAEIMLGVFAICRITAKVSRLRTRSSLTYSHHEFRATDGTSKVPNSCML